MFSDRTSANYTNPNPSHTLRCFFFSTAKGKKGRSVSVGHLQGRQRVWGAMANAHMLRDAGNTKKCVGNKALCLQQWCDRFLLFSDRMFFPPEKPGRKVADSEQVFVFAFVFGKYLVERGCPPTCSSWILFNTAYRFRHDRALKNEICYFGEAVSSVAIS